MHGLIDVDVVGRIDSVNGGIRSTFEAIPDQPVSKFMLTLKGGGKGILVNSTNICNTERPGQGPDRRPERRHGRPAAAPEERLRVELQAQEALAKSVLRKEGG